jgi:hypothetical protein
MMHGVATLQAILGNRVKQRCEGKWQKAVFLKTEPDNLCRSGPAPSREIAAERTESLLLLLFKEAVLPSLHLALTTARYCTLRSLPVEHAARRSRSFSGI